MFVAACALELGARASAACGCKMSFCSVGACMLVWVLLPLQEAVWALELGCWCRCRVGCRKMSTAACTFEPTCLCRCRVRSLVLVPLQVPWGCTQRQHWLFSTRQNDMDKHKNVEQIKHIFLVVSHKALAEVSKIGNHRQGELLRRLAGRANPLTERQVFEALRALSLSVSLYLSLCVSMCPSIYPSPFIYLSILSIYLSIYLPIYLSVAYLSIYPILSYPIHLFYSILLYSILFCF